MLYLFSEILIKNHVQEWTLRAYIVALQDANQTIAIFCQIGLKFVRDDAATANISNDYDICSFDSNYILKDKILAFCDVFFK